MPIREFHCERCDRDFEELVRTSGEKAGVACPSCGNRQVERKISVFAAQTGAGVSRVSSLPAGGCGRCGDPAGPCSLG